MKSKLLRPCSTPDRMFNERQLRMGVEVEMEHTTSRAAAKCIAKHHLTEESEAKGVPLKSKHIRYYTDLLAFERRWKRRG